MMRIIAVVAQAVGVVWLAGNGQWANAVFSAILWIAIDYVFWDDR